MKRKEQLEEEDEKGCEQQCHRIIKRWQDNHRLGGGSGGGGGPLGEGRRFLFIHSGCMRLSIRGERLKSCVGRWV